LDWPNVLRWLPPMVQLGMAWLSCLLGIDAFQGEGEGSSHEGIHERAQMRRGLTRYRKP
jgi:hypothetical protein